MNDTERWDKVQRFMGRIDERTLNMEEKLDNLCEKTINHEDRISKNETYISNQKAVNKKMAVLYGVIISVVTALANIAFKFFK